MNTPQKQIFTEENSILRRLILWIILILVASLGCYLANYALIFHIKSAILSWLGVWLALFGLAFQFWTKGLSPKDDQKGPYSISSIPEITAEVLIIMGILFYTTNIYFIVGWIFIYPFFINLRSSKTKQKLHRPRLNFLSNYKEPTEKFNYKLAISLTALDVTLTSFGFLILEIIREFSVKKIIKPNIYVLIVFIISIVLFILSRILFNTENTNPSQPTHSKKNYE